MKMLMIIIDRVEAGGAGGLPEPLGRCRLHRNLPGCRQWSLTGPRLGSSAFPKTSAVVFTILDDEALQGLREGVDRFCATCGEELRMISWDVDVLR